jgi:hypothetical protein
VPTLEQLRAAHTAAWDASESVKTNTVDSKERARARYFEITGATPLAQLPATDTSTYSEGSRPLPITEWKANQARIAKEKKRIRAQINDENSDQPSTSGQPSIPIGGY